MSNPTTHVAARMYRGLQKCRRCGLPLSRKWDLELCPDPPRFKPGRRVVMIWNPPYRAIWAEGAYPASKGEPVECVTGEPA